MPKEARNRGVALPEGMEWPRSRGGEGVFREVTTDFVRFHGNLAGVWLPVGGELLVELGEKGVNSSFVEIVEM